MLSFYFLFYQCKVIVLHFHLQIPPKTSSSDDEYVFVEDEKISESECTPDSPANENSEMPLNTDEVP